MAKKEFSYRGKKLEELQAMSLKEVAELFPSPSRRKILRGFTEQEKIFLKNLESSQKPVKTHCRDMLILPSMVNKNIKIYTGKEFKELIIQAEMIGHRLGEFAQSRKRVNHGDAGVGSSKGKGKVSVRS